MRVIITDDYIKENAKFNFENDVITINLELFGHDIIETIKYINGKNYNNSLEIIENQLDILCDILYDYIYEMSIESDFKQFNFVDHSVGGFVIEESKND